MSAIWYNESMVGQVVSGLTMDEIKAQIDSMGAGLGDHAVSISVDAQARGTIHCSGQSMTAAKRWTTRWN